MNYFPIDFFLIEGLLQKTGKRSLDAFLYRELGIPSDNITEPERVQGLYTLYHSGKLEKYIEDHALKDVLELERDLIPVLFAMESKGVCFDQAKAQNIRERIRNDIAKLESEIYEIMGTSINLNSPKQLQGFFFETLGLKPIKKNKTGYSVDTDVLEEIAKTHDVARMILEYRNLSKLASTYVDGLLTSVDMRDGRIHTTYDSLGAVTGRMSSNDPNLQNIPTGDGYAREIKSCFTASPGHILMVADYSQIELRILAFLSGDPALQDAFMRGEDIHTRTARFLFENSLSYALSDDWKPTTEERRIAKTVNFGVIYGITGFGLAKTLGVSPWEAQRYIDSFYLRYPEVRSYYDRLIENARNTGYVKTVFGRKRLIPTLNDANKNIRSIAEREAINMPIQGTSADIIKIAMREIHHVLESRRLKGKMILQVHDELVFDIPHSEQETFADMIPKIMEGILDTHFKDTSYKRIPLVVDVGWGENWAEAK